MQNSLEIAPTLAEYVPSGQLSQPVSSYVPGLGANFPAAQSKQASGNWAPIMDEYFPLSHN